MAEEQSQRLRGLKRKSLSGNRRGRAEEKHREAVAAISHSLPWLLYCRQVIRPASKGAESLSYPFRSRIRQPGRGLPLCYITVHEDKMAHAPSHDEQMEHLMGAELPVPGIEKGKLQRVDDPSHGIDDASRQQPEERCCAQCV